MKHPPMYEFTIIVPVYNEEDNLERVEQELVAYIQIAAKKTAILFVNDGSKDNSQILIEAICNRNEAFHYISFKENRGLSAAISRIRPCEPFVGLHRRWFANGSRGLQQTPGIHWWLWFGHGRSGRPAKILCKEYVPASPTAYAGHLPNDGMDDTVAPEGH